MAKIAFQSRITPTTGYFTDGEMKVWVCETSFSDNEGVFTGLDLAVGDVIAFDTAMYEPGTFTFYQISNILTPDVSSPVIEITYMDVNDNSWGAPDLSSLFGFAQTVSRPSANLGLLPVVSKDTQGVSDKYTEYVQNYNFTKIVDGLQGGDVTFTKTNGETSPLLKGTVVYIPWDDGEKCKRAIANAYETSCVIGMVADVIAPANGTTKVSSKGMVEKPAGEWAIVTGNPNGLEPGRDYFLRADMLGGITAVPPVDHGQYVVKVGKAVSPTLFDLNIEPPIQL